MIYTVLKRVPVLSMPMWKARRTGVTLIAGATFVGRPFLAPGLYGSHGWVLRTTAGGYVAADRVRALP